MRSTIRSDTEAPRWLLWLVALTSFGPVMVLWLLGVLYSLFWAGWLFVALTDPERLPDAFLSDGAWDFVWPMGLVVAGFLGLVGLLRVLTLSHRERPSSPRVFTMGMVAVGLTGLAIFDVPLLLEAISGFPDGIPAAPIVLYLVLPFAGAAWVLCKSKKFLLADRRRDRSDD
jgi:hypothetical protein